jgi:hypothetical protein
MHSEEVVAQVGEARVQAQQEAIQMEQAQQASVVAKNVDGPAQELAKATQ